MATLNVKDKLYNQRKPLEVESVTGDEPLLVESPVELGSDLEVDGNLKLNSGLTARGINITDESVNVSIYADAGELAVEGADSVNFENHVYVGGDLQVEGNIIQTTHEPRNIVVEDNEYTLNIADGETVILRSDNSSSIELPIDCIVILSHLTTNLTTPFDSYSFIYNDYNGFGCAIGKEYIIKRINNVIFITVTPNEF